MTSSLIPSRNVTPDDVLWALREFLVVSWAEYGRVPALVDFDTTVAEFVSELPDSDVMCWWDVAGMLNATLCINVPLSAWRPALTPRRKRVLLDVCHLVAQFRCVPHVRSARVLGRSCQAAGAFLAIRELCRQRAIPVDDLRPSTRLEPFLRENLTRILIDLRLLAGPRTPCVDLEFSKHPLTAGKLAVRAMAAVLFLAAVPLGAVSCWYSGPVGLLAVMIWIGTDRQDLAAIRLGDLRDFRDLSYAICGQTPPPRRNRSAACPA